MHFNQSVANVNLIPESPTGASASAQDANGFTALIKAVANGHTDIVDLLLARGAPVNTPAGTHTALRAATLNGQAALVDKLLKAGADASICSNNARTPLMGACFARDGVTPHEALFQSVPDTSTLVPFYPHIYDNLGHDSRHDSRGIAARFPVVCT